MHDERHPEPDDPPDTGIAGAEVSTPSVMPTTPLSPTAALVIACPGVLPDPALLKPPRADLLTRDQAGQLYLELLAGCEPPDDLSTSITECLVIADTGCATSMGNHKDQFLSLIHISEPTRRS
eukprot:443218-Prymnesium_polylepis.1